jgi:Gpi18-like mannosyltransferase
VVTFTQWAETAQKVGLAHLYGAARVDHPPLFLYLLTAAGWLDARLPPSLAAPALIAFIKLPSFLADILTAGLIALVWRTRSSASALTAAAVYVFNPAVWYVSAYYGQTDSIYTLFLVIAVIGLEQQKLTTASLGFMFALATKLQSISLAPLLVADALIRHKPRDWVRAAIAVCLAGAALLSPWLVERNVDSVIRAYTALPSEAPKVVVSAYNLWYMVRLGHVHEVSSELYPLGLPVTYQTIGILVFGIFSLGITGLYVLRRAVFLTAAALVLGLYMLLTQMHERYMFPVLAMLALASVSQPRLWLLYAVLSLSFFFNLVTIAPFTPLLGDNLVATQVPSPTGVFLKTVALVCAAINVLALIAIVVALARSRSTGILSPSGIDKMKAVRPRGSWRNSSSRPNSE